VKTKTVPSEVRDLEGETKLHSGVRSQESKFQSQLS
jgi:hypothetical protein